MKAAIAGLAAALMAVGAQAYETPAVETDRTRTTIVFAVDAAPPGATTAAALRIETAPGWHIYWRNPGDAGEPPSLSWSQPEVAEPLTFPIPEPVPTPPLMSYGHKGDVLFPFAYRQSGAAVDVEARWLVCAEICVPESARFSLKLELADEPIEDPIWAAEIEKAEALQPQSAPTTGEFALDGAEAVLRFDWPGLDAASVTAAYFYPYMNGVTAASMGQSQGVDGAALTLRAAAGWKGFDGVDQLDGVLTYALDAGGEVAFETTLVRSSAPAAAPPLSDIAGVEPAAAAVLDRDAVGFVAALALALVGGLVLNLMPCVFPILSLKAVGLAKAAQDGAARRHAAAYCVGALTTFLALGGALAAAKASGGAVGWGFQLQSPPLIATLALLFFVIGLNLIGAFTVSIGRLASLGPNAGPFLTGVLAVIATTPCTAPFMAAALGYAATASAFESLMVFAALGLGFIAPFAIILAIPGFARRLPRPGRWMETLKQALSFPMFATVVWLLWVFTMQVGAVGAAALGGALVAAAMAVWVWERFDGAVLGRGVAGLAAATAFALGAAGATALDNRAAVSGDQVWSPARVAALRAEGRPVFVEFTAAWCVTCLVNKQTSLTPESVRAAFAEKDVAILIGDWTEQDPRIAQALSEHGRDGVPLYLLYPADGGAPQTLPQILTPQIVIDALDGLG